MEAKSRHKSTPKRTYIEQCNGRHGSCQDFLQRRCLRLRDIFTSCDICSYFDFMQIFRSYDSKASNLLKGTR